MWHARIDEALIAADERGEIEGGIVDAHAIAASENGLSDFDHWAFAQIVRVRLKGEAENNDFSLAALGDQTEEGLEMPLVAGEQVFEHRQMQPVLASVMGEGANIL